MINLLRINVKKSRNKKFISIWWQVNDFEIVSIFRILDRLFYTSIFQNYFYLQKILYNNNFGNSKPNKIMYISGNASMRFTQLPKVCQREGRIIISPFQRLRQKNLPHTTITLSTASLESLSKKLNTKNQHCQICVEKATDKSF